MKKIIILIGLFLIIIVETVFSQQKIISGLTITKTVRWSGTVIIQGDVVVARSGRLVIEPGSKILFSSNMDKQQSGYDKTRAELIVEGVIISRGEISNKILFSSNSKAPRMGDWYGIRIANPKQKSIFEYVIIEYAYNGISIKQSSSQIISSQIRFNYNAGIVAEVRAEPKIMKNIISYNGYAGIICNLGAKPVLTDNMITENQIGVVSFSVSQPNMGSLKKGKDYNIGRNRLFDNHEYNVYNHSTKSIKAENNTWGTNSPRELAATLYDNNNDRKYGGIDTQPLFVAENIDEFILLSQSVNETSTEESAVSETEEEIAVNEEQTKQDKLLAETQANIKDVNNITPITTEQATVKDQQSSADNVLSSDAKTNEPALAVNEEKEEVPLPQEQIEEKKDPVKPKIDYGSVFLDAFLDQKKEIIKKAAPVIRDARRGLGAKGKVIVRVIVAKNGSVESASILKGLNYYYDDISLKAARKFRFKPGKVNANSVRFSTNVFFQF
ncbi:MAG: TonB family protein [Calditrichales bacterium]|nr:TonB family protein [Calditrichales bacterium]